MIPPLFQLPLRILFCLHDLYIYLADQTFFGHIILLSICKLFSFHNNKMDPVLCSTYRSQRLKGTINISIYTEQTGIFPGGL